MVRMQAREGGCGPKAVPNGEFTRGGSAFDTGCRAAARPRL